MFLPIMLDIIEGIWDLISKVGHSPDLSDLDRKPDLIVGADYAEEVTWIEAELLNATLQALECLREGGSPWRAGNAAHSAYNAVSKWYCAKAYPGKAMKAAQTIEFEKQNPECQAEFAFQLGCLSVLERMAGGSPSYAVIMASLAPETATEGPANATGKG
jgi:hypothetical protein